MILEVGAAGIIEIPFNRTRYEYHQYGLWGPHGVKKGDEVLDTNGNRVPLGSELHERYEEDRYELSCFGLRKKLIRSKGDLKLNYANRAILKPVVKEMLDPYALDVPVEKTIYNAVPKVEFNGMRDGGPAMISLQTHQDALRESRTVKNIARNLKHYKDRELMKLFDKVNTEIIKRGLKVVGDYQPVIEDEFTEPKNPPRGR